MVEGHECEGGNIVEGRQAVGEGEGEERRQHRKKMKTGERESSAVWACKGYP